MSYSCDRHALKTATWHDRERLLFSCRQTGKQRFTYLRGIKWRCKRHAKADQENNCDDDEAPHPSISLARQPTLPVTSIPSLRGSQQSFMLHHSKSS